MEILILHPGALGDIILSLPAISMLRRRHSSAGITIAGNIDHLVPVVSGYADKTLSLAALPLHSLYGPGALPEADLRFWRSFDLIVSWTGAGDPAFVRRFREIHPNVRIASWKPATGEQRHVSQLFVAALDSGDNAAVRMEPVPILLNAELRAEGKQWLMERGWNGLDSLTALHPGAGSPTKRWPVSRFISLAQRLVLQERRRLLIIEGDAERGVGRQIVRTLPPAEAILFDRMSLSLLSAVLAECALFIGNDAGPAHLAAALAVRCVVLFGPTLPQHWAPLGWDVTVLRDAGNCGACASGGDRHTCLENISVEEVIRNSKFEIGCRQS